MAVLGTHRSIVDGKRGQGRQTVRRGLRCVFRVIAGSNFR